MLDERLIRMTYPGSNQMLDKLSPESSHRDVFGVGWMVLGIDCLGTGSLAAVDEILESLLRLEMSEGRV